MKTLFWLALLVSAVAAGALIWHTRRKFETRRQAEEARLAAFISEKVAAPMPGEASPAPAARPAAAVAANAAADDLAMQKLLFEAAHKAGEAGEPALAIQLYARLLQRYPGRGLAEPARAAAAALKKRLVKS